jgi:ribosome-binding ATPase
MARLGILGFPNTGKTTLFNALTGLQALTASHPYSTREPNVGVARVPDDALDSAAELERSAKTVHATLDLLDLPALAKPGHGGGLAGQFLGRLREMDALVVVLRAFADPTVPDDESGVDPVAQAEELSLELAIADAEVFERRRDKVAKEATADPSKRPAAAAIAEAAELLAGGIPLRARDWSEEAKAAFRDLAPLTLIPAVWVVNVGEDEEELERLAGLVRSAVPEGDTVVAISARIEEEGARLDPSDRAELFAELGLGEGALATMVRAAHDALGLVSFYTIGPKEAHAWTVRRGVLAPEAAGKIHSDLERGFIRAEVAPMPEVLDAGGWDAAKKANRVRVEGKDYEVQEGDVIVVRFSV